MRSLKGLFAVLALASVAAACAASFAPTPSSQAYQDYVTNTHLIPDVDSHTHMMVARAKTGRSGLGARLARSTDLL